MICLENDNKNNYDIFNQLLDKNNILTPELDYNDGIIDDYTNLFFQFKIFCLIFYIFSFEIHIYLHIKKLLFTII